MSWTLVTMSNSPITLSHWHTEPALIGGTLFVCWAYFVLVGPVHSATKPRLPPLERVMPVGLGPVILSFYLAVGSPL